MRLDFGDGILLGVLLTWVYMSTYYETLGKRGNTKADAVAGGLGALVGTFVVFALTVAVLHLLWP